MLGLMNLGTMVKVKCERSIASNNPDFQRFFVSFSAQKLGFLNGCRPFIGMDGRHSKGKYGRVLLFVVCLDANSSIFPIAICVCEGGNLNSWS